MSTPGPDDPIVAIATASGRGAVGIVRVSGRDLAPLARAICGVDLAPRHARYTAFHDRDGAAIDRGLALFFPAPHSSTGEDVLELQAHGGPVVLQLLVERCLDAASSPDASGNRPLLAGLRLARPGEFTERAFLHDKLDLAQAEAVADLIDASTETAARSAARSLSGAFSQEVDALAAALIELRLLVEATLDFPEEEIEFLESGDARGRLARASAGVDRVLARARQGALLRDGIRVVLAGQPNVGKSSLLNALAGAELAIVTATPGTTRDKVAETIQIEGVPLHVVDTAGLRDASEEVERIGVARSWDAIAEADAVVFLHDLTRIGGATYDAEDEAIGARLPAALAAQGRLVDVYNKVDAAPAPAPASAPGSASASASTSTASVPASTSPSASASPSASREAIVISAATGAGLPALRAKLLALAGWQSAPEGVFIARARHVEALRRARGHLDAAIAHAAEGNAALELFAEELRLAHDALGEITGAFTSDDLLGAIFGRFCIGK